MRDRTVTEDMLYLPYEIRAEGKMMPNSTTDEELEAIITSGAVDSVYTHLALSSLRNFLTALRDGTKVLAGHRTDGPVLGKSFDGELDEENMLLYAKFYIQRGLPTPNAAYGTTDAYLDSAKRGTMDEISAGFYDFRQICDHDGLEMKPIFIDEDFIRFRFCPNGHYAGERIWVDEDDTEIHPSDAPDQELTEKIITATIEDAKLGEFSIVTKASNPDAKVVNRSFELWQQGKLENKHIHYLECQNGPAFGMELRSKIEGAGDPRKTSLPPTPQPPIIGGKTMTDQERQEFENNIQQLTEQLNSAKNAEKAATDERDEMKTQLEAQRNANEEVVTENARLQTENNEMRQKLDATAKAIDEHKRLIEEERNLAIGELDRLNLAPADYEEKKKNITDSDSLTVIRSWKGIWGNEADNIYKGGTRTSASEPKAHARPNPLGSGDTKTYQPHDPNQY